MSSSVLSRLTSLSTVVAIAHRGGAKLRPENTMPAFEHAVSLGVDALECDVHLSRDGEVVVIHDATLDRTTDTHGDVSGRRAADLARVDAGHQFGPAQGFPYRGAGIGVPRLEDLLRRWPDMPFVVEIKGDRPETAVRTLEVIREAGADERVIVGGFSMAVLGEVRRLASHLLTSASSAEVQAALRRSYFLLSPRRTGFHLFQVPVRLKGRRVLTRPFVRAIRRAGVPVQAWIVDELDEMERLVDWGVTGLISDRPDRAVELVRRVEADKGRQGR
jgi:glycerophosphoryl diester phosphodiesterase